MNQKHDFNPAWVFPYYMRLMGFFYISEEERQQLTNEIRVVLSEIDDDSLAKMLASINWRPRLTAAHFIGFGKLKSHADSLGQCILDHPDYAHHHCFALARLGVDVAILYLQQYLRKHLQVTDTSHGAVFLLEGLSVSWILAVLRHFDEQLGTSNFEEFDPIWEYFLQTNGNGQFHAIVERHIKETWNQERVIQVQELLEFYLQFASENFD